MPRRTRLLLPGVPLHITQRGVNRGAVFVDDEDRGHYLQLLQRACQDHAVALHAYVLMGNHVHLLMASDEAGAVSEALRWLGPCYVQAFNRRHRRSGTLWEGRFKSCLVDTDRYLLTVIRYIELNPVRARIAESATAYPWSSARAHLDLVQDPLLTPHPTWLGLGADAAERAQCWRAWLQSAIAPEELEGIRQHLRQQRALGEPRFQAMVETVLGRPVRMCRRGRPLVSKG